MPVVPRSQDPVRQQAFPQQRVNTEASIEAFGGGPALDRSGRAFEQAAGQFQRVVQEREKAYQEQLKKANDLAVTEALYKLRREETRLLRDPNEGAYTRKKKNALGLPEEYGGRFKKYADELEQSLANEDQKVLFRRQRLTREAEFNDTLTAIVAREYEAYGKELFSVAMDAEEEAAVANADNPAMIARSIHEIKRLAKGLEANQGMPEGWGHQEEVKKRVDRIHSAVISKLLEQRRYREAEDYFKAANAEMDPKTKKPLAERLGKAKVDYDSVDHAARIWAKHSDNQQAALDEAREISDPAVAEKTRRLLKDRFEDQKRANQESEEETFKRLYNHISETGELPPENELSALPPGRQNTLREHQRKVRTGSDKHDADAYREFFELTKEDLARMSNSDFVSKYLSKFSLEKQREARVRYDAAQKTARGEKAPPLLSDTNLAIIRGLQQSGFLKPGETMRKNSWSEADRALVDELIREADEIRARQFEETGKYMTEREVQEWFNQQLVDKVFLKKAPMGIDWLQSDPERRVRSLSPEERLEAYVPMQQIPESDRTATLSWLRSKGLIRPELTDAEALKRSRSLIERAYGMRRVGLTWSQVLEELRK